MQPAPPTCVQRWTSSGQRLPALDADLIPMTGGSNGGISPSNSPMEGLFTYVSPMGTNISPSSDLARSHYSISKPGLDEMVLQMEQAYAETRLAISRAPRRVLMLVLNSLLDDYGDHLLASISAKLEAAVAVSTGSPMRSAASATARTPQRMGSNSSLSTPHKKSKSYKGKEEEEQEMCTVHNTMRSMKHLQPNPATGRMECIHGFHCLVDTPVASSLTEKKSEFTVTSPAFEKSSSKQQTNNILEGFNGLGPHVQGPRALFQDPHMPLHPHTTTSQLQLQHEHLKMQQQHLQEQLVNQAIQSDPNGFFSPGSHLFAAPAFSTSAVKQSPVQPEVYESLLVDAEEDDEGGTNTLNAFVNSLGDD